MTDGETATCRICFEDGSPKDVLVAPCKCKGTPLLGAVYLRRPHYPSQDPVFVSLNTAAKVLLLGPNHLP